MRNRFALSALIILLALLALALAGCERDRPVPTPDADIATPEPTSAAEEAAPAGPAGAESPVPTSGTSPVEQPPQPTSPTSQGGATSTTGTAGTQGAGTATTYVIQSGDTLNAIAREYGVAVQALRAANPAITNPDVLTVGMEIVIPAEGTSQGSSETTTQESGQQSATAYTIQRGDTLTSVAQKFGVSVRQLQELNNISDPNDIRLGQQIRIPTTTSAPDEATSDEGAPDEGASGEDAEGGETYVVQQGDTLNSIATRYGITTAELQRANDISDPDLIYPGQVLIIP